jgi:hypothetical protein
MTPPRPPPAQVDIVAAFSPQLEKPLNLNVSCRVPGKPTPLSLNVKGEGYALRAGLQLGVADGGAVELAPLGENAVDFGQARRGWAGGRTRRFYARGRGIRMPTLHADGHVLLAARVELRTPSPDPWTCVKRPVLASPMAFSLPSPRAGHHQRPRRAPADPGQRLARQV